MTETYDGTEKTASGYEATSESTMFDESKVAFTGIIAKHRRPDIDRLSVLPVLVRVLVKGCPRRRGGLLVGEGEGVAGAPQFDMRRFRDVILKRAVVRCAI